MECHEEKGELSDLAEDIGKAYDVAGGALSHDILIRSDGSVR